MSTAASPSSAARQAQRVAADPVVSAWVSANAGTGKTQVLTDRILRLLLAGTRPERILALTYTKAAAAEMATRVFDRLATWVTATPADLEAALCELKGSPPTELERLTARRLFAAAIETPGGLKVQTIHAFAERLLQRFPLEAGIAPGFRILDDRQTADLLREATDAVLLTAANAADSDLGQALATLVGYAVDDQFDALVRDALAQRDWLLALARLDSVAELQAAYRDRLGLPADLTRATAQAAAADVLAPATLAALADVLAAGSKSELDLAPAFRAAAAAPTAVARIDALARALLTTGGEARKRILVKASSSAHPHLPPLLERAQSAFLAAREHLLGLELLEATLALGRLATAVLDHYAAAKARRGLLDFDDLIRKTGSLLVPPGSSTGAAEWVLYKLDGGLDHLLVDEAQDTARSQWAMIEALAAEFFVDQGVGTTLRTVFAVGDEKQSIYSFQGAAPDLLRQQGENFAARAAAAGRRFELVPLTVSFRTTAPVLQAVDAVFADPAVTPGVGAGDAAAGIRHVVHRLGQAGRVELWPVERPEVVATADPWRPLDERSVASPVTRLAQRIATTIAAWLRDGERLASEDRPLTAGDILVLVPRRGSFAPAMVAALKVAAVPVAGADRLVLTEQIAVEDLLTLADVLVLPEDDLALATVLKSPLFGLDDDDLMTLTDGPGGTLWGRLLGRGAADPRFGEAVTRLRAWRAQADFQPPYEFFAGLLEREQSLMRRRLLARLGAEAADPLDALLDLALTYDATEAPSLQGFLTWVRSGRPEIKRDMDQGRDEVRVMTVHGAKGLEAPVVFLPDTCSAVRPRSIATLPLGSSPLSGSVPLRLWPVKGSKDHPVVTAAKADMLRLEQAERDRLLYVALTRPRDRLYIAGFTTVGADKPLPPESWYAKVERALAPLLATDQDREGRPIRVLEVPQTAPPGASRRPPATVDGTAALPEWAIRPAADETAPTIPLVPSQLAPLDTDAAGDALEAPPRPRDDAPALPPGPAVDNRRFLRGTLTHALLEHLPALPTEHWVEAARAFVAARGAVLDARRQASIVAETLAILRDPTFAPLFGPESQAEVPIVAVLERPQGSGPALRLTGVIDRLAVTAQGVLILDYKTNRPPPTERADVPLAYRLQLAAYRLAVQRLYPGQPVTAAILWTDGARLMEIPAADLDAAEPQLWR